MSTAQMITSSPQSDAALSGPLSEAIDQLLACAASCAICAEACLHEDDPRSQVDCISSNSDCADVCMATARVLGRASAGLSAMARLQVEACIEACRTCGDECDRHASHMEHCAICRDACRECERLCQALLSS
ncbi:four-helix bundle copper-binding protein [soil metagenome]|jgi:hypothetical protein